MDHENQVNSSSYNKLDAETEQQETTIATNSIYTSDDDFILSPYRWLM